MTSTTTTNLTTSRERHAYARSVQRTLECRCDPGYRSVETWPAADPCGHGDTSEGCPRHDDAVARAIAELVHVRQVLDAMREQPYGAAAAEADRWADRERDLIDELDEFDVDASVLR